jgi:hypothetical protein
MKKINLTRRAVEERIRRSLEKEDISLRKDRITGEYFGVDVMRNAVAWDGLSLEELAEQLEALKPWETLNTSNAGEAQ